MPSKQPRRKSQARERERQYRQQLRELKRTGLYAPKGDTLTSHRKKTITRLTRENKELLSDRYSFAKAPPLARKEAEKIGFKTTPKGIMVPKDKYSTKAKVRWSRRRKQYEIEQYHRRKEGSKYRVVEDRKIPIVPPDVMLLEKERLRRKVNTFGPLAKNQVLYYVVYGRGYSRTVFDNLDLMWDFIVNRYTPDKRLDWLDAIQHISVERGTITEWREAAAPHRAKPKRRRAKPARYIR